jgi:peptide/nickel transport system substrate-binding protein
VARTRFAFITGLVVATLGVSACAATVVSRPSRQVSRTVTSSGSTFVYDTIYNDITAPWDPSVDYNSALLPLSNMYQTLTHYNSTTKKVTPVLATSWSSADGGTVWTFHLRHGVKFVTGRPMNAAAVEASIERTIALNEGAAYEWGAVSSITAPSPYTVVITCKYASPIDLISSSDYGASIYDTQASGTEDLGKWLDAGHDAGTGPYEVQSWSPGQEIEVILKADPAYWGGWTGDHYKRVVYRYTPDATTATQLAESHQVTYVQFLSPQLWNTFKSKKDYQTPSILSWQNLILDYNAATGPLTNLDFRKAVSEAINYKGIVAALGAHDTRTPGVVPPGLIGYDPSLPEYSTNLSQAKAFLKQSGMQGKNVTLSITAVEGDTTEQTAAVLIKSSLAKIGVTVDIRSVSVTTSIAEGDAPSPAARPSMTLFYWYPDYADPYSWFVNCYTTQNPPVWNFTGYSDPTLDAQISKVEAIVAVNKAEGAQAYELMQKEIYQDDVSVTLLNLNYERLVVGNVKGFVDNPGYPNVVFVYPLTP